MGIRTFILSLFLLQSILLFGQVRPDDTTRIDSVIRLAGELQREFPDSARFLLDDCEKTANANRDSVALMRILTFRGIEEYNQANYDAATEFYYQSLALAERFGRMDQIAMISNNLGTVFFDLQQLEKAESFYKRAFDIMLVENNKKWMSKINGNRAGVAFMSGDPDKAIELLNYSIRDGIEASEFVSVAGAYSNLAMVLQSLNRKEEALTTFHQGIKMLENSGDKRGVCIVLNRLGELQADLGDMIAAENTLRKGLSLATEIDHKESIMRAHLLLSNYFQSFNKDSSYHHLKLHVAWKDSVFGEKQFETISELEKKYETEKREAEIEKLTAQTEKDQAIKRSKNLQVAVFGSIAVLAIVVSVFIVLLLRSKKRQNTLLSEKNEIISRNLEEKELLMLEMHHRVKNNFQLVSGVLMIQANSSEDQNVKQSLLNVRNRIQSMAQTHQRLYHSDSITEVAVKAFITDLVQEVELGHADSEVKVVVDVSDFKLPVDYAVTMGLVITEAMINSFKYAFAETTTPELKISVGQKDGSVYYHVIDNGVGISEDYAPSFGTKMIKNLVSKAGGEIVWENRSGTFMSVTIPLR